MYYNEISVENEIITFIFAEKGPYNMTMWFVVHLIVTDTSGNGLMPDGTKPLPAPMLTYYQ